MKKHNLIIVIFLVVAGIIFIKMSDSKEIKKINVYLESYDINIFDKNNVISISDKNSIRDIVDVLDLENKKVRIFGDDDFGYNPAGYIEIIYYDGDNEKYYYFENKKGFYLKKSNFIYYVWHNDSFDILYTSLR